MFIKNLFNFLKKYYVQINLLIVKSIVEIIIHVLKLLQKNECFTSKPHAHGTFWNLHIKINLKIHISKTNRSIKFNFVFSPFSKFRLCSIKIIKFWQLKWQFQIQQNSVPVSLNPILQDTVETNSLIKAQHEGQDLWK